MPSLLRALRALGEQAPGLTPNTRPFRELGLQLGREHPAYTVLGETVHINGFPYTVVGKIRKKEQDSNYRGPDNDKVFVPFAAIARDFPRPDVPPGTLSQIIVAPKAHVVAGLEQTGQDRCHGVGVHQVGVAGQCSNGRPSIAVHVMNR